MLSESAELCFVDTNIWLYAFIKGQDVEKAAVANTLIRTSWIAISTQVINEVCRNLLRKKVFTDERMNKFWISSPPAMIATQLSN